MLEWVWNRSDSASLSWVWKLYFLTYCHIFQGQWAIYDMMTSRHQMETFSMLLAICAGNSPVPGEFPTQRPVTRSFDVFFDLRLIKRLSKQSWGWWLETLLCPIWRHRNETICCLFNSLWPCDAIGCHYTHTQQSCRGEYWFHSVRPSVCPSVCPSICPASCVRSVASTVLIASISYNLHI